MDPLLRGKNGHVRRKLMLMRGWDLHWAKLAHGMLDRGKPKNVVVAAVANRWVRWLHHELRREPATSAQARQKGVAGDRCTLQPIHRSSGGKARSKQPWASRLVPG